MEFILDMHYFILFLITLISIFGCGDSNKEVIIEDSKNDQVIVENEPEPEPEPEKDIIKNEIIEIKSCKKYAGAICSLKYKGFEIVDNKDFGRQIQSAVNYPTHSGPESYNPTEAGNIRDVSESSSELLNMSIKDNVLYTNNQMAYWLEPNQCNNGVVSCAVNKKELSNTFVSKEISIGYQGFNNVVHFKTLFDVESNVEEGVRLDGRIQFQVVATHTPSSWDKFYLYQEKLVPFEVPIKDKNYPYYSPIISSSRDGSIAIALLKIPNNSPTEYVFDLYSMKHADRAASSLPNESGITALFDLYITPLVLGSTHYFETLLILGTLEEVKDTIEHFHKEKD